jgi:hypothetical protein
MSKSNYKEFLNKNANNIEKKAVNLTHEQVETLEAISKWMKISFEDAVMVMVHQQFLAMDKAADWIENGRKARLN